MCVPNSRFMMAVLILFFNCWSGSDLVLLLETSENLLAFAAISCTMITTSCHFLFSMAALHFSISPTMVASAIKKAIHH